MADVVEHVVDTSQVKPMGSRSTQTLEAYKGDNADKKTEAIEVIKDAAPALIDFGKMMGDVSSMTKTQLGIIKAYSEIEGRTLTELLPGMDVAIFNTL